MKQLFLGVAAASLISAPAYAQISQDEIVPNYLRIEDAVTVFDQVRRASDTAESVDLLPADALKLINPVHPAEALNTVAGVNIHRGSGQEHLTAIRSPVLTGGAGAGSFLYLQDGVPLRAAGFANVNGLFEAAPEFARQIEVFKGPGPAEYGSNAVHGLINVVSADVGTPNTLSITGSSRGYLGAKAGVTFGNARLSGALAHDDGFRDDSGFDQQKLQLRYDTNLGPWDVDWISSFNNLNQETAGFLQGDDAYKDREFIMTNAFPEAFRDARSFRSQATFEKRDANKTITLTPYARHTEIEFLRHFVPGQALEKNKHSSIGLQSAVSGLNWSAGLDAEYTKGSLFEFQENPSRFSFVQGLHYDYDVQAIVIAGYAQRAFVLGEKTRLELGARGEYTSYDYDNRADAGQSGRFIRAADRKDDFFTLTPKASLVHEVGRTTSLFARAARGSRAPQTSDLYSAQQNQVPGEAEVEALDSLEAGLRYEKEIAFEATVFSMWKDNFFFRNANGFNVVNGKTRHEGIELSARLPITPWLTLSGQGSYARHSYDFTETVGSAANNITAGDRVDSAPDTLATFTAALSPSPDWTAQLQWSHVGRYFTNPGNTAEYPGHDVLALRGQYRFGNGVELSARIDNLLDTRYADRADFAFGNERFFPGRPRTVFAGLTYEF